MTFYEKNELSVWNFSSLMVSTVLIPGALWWHNDRYIWHNKYIPYNKYNNTESIKAD